MTDSPSKYRNGDTFRPALRFPTDPHRPSQLPTRTKQIIQQQPPSQHPAAHRKPWELDVEKLQDSAIPGQRRVIVIIGDPPHGALDPFVSSHYLRRSLLIIITSADANLGISPQSTIPDVRILRLKSTSPSNPEVLTASRLVRALEWAHNIAADWRSDAHPIRFSVALEESADGKTQRSKTIRFRAKSQSVPAFGKERDDDDGDDQRRATPAAALWPPRLPTSSSASSASGSTRSSVYMMGADIDNSHKSRHASRPNAGSTASVPETANATPTRRLRNSASTSTFTNVSLTKSLEAVRHASVSNTRPMSMFSVRLGKDGKKDKARRNATATTPAAPRRSFDVIVNFLPSNPLMTTAGYGIGVSYGPGTLSTLNAQAAHNKTLLRQTILVTTATQRFLCPPVPRASRNTNSSLSRSRTREDQDADWNMSQHRKRTQSSSKRFSVAISSVFSGKSSLPTPPTSTSSSSASGSSSPPESRLGLPGAGSALGHSSGMSSLGHGGAGAGADDYGLGDMAGSINGHSILGSSFANTTLARIIHVLPFSHNVSPHLVNSPIHLGNARLIRSLEAFLLSWSFGGKESEAGTVAGKLSETLTQSGLDTPTSSYPPSPAGSSSSLSSLASLGSNLPGSAIRNATPGIIRPFLLDIGSLGDVFTTGGMTGEEPQKWTIAEMVISGVIDEEYSLSQESEMAANPSPGLTPSSSNSGSSSGSGPRPRTAPALSNSAPSSPAVNRPKTGQWESINGLAGIGIVKGVHGTKGDGWANRRAWLGGVKDISLVPFTGTTDRDRFSSNVDRERSLSPVITPHRHSSHGASSSSVSPPSRSSPLRSTSSAPPPSTWSHGEHEKRPSLTLSVNETWGSGYGGRKTLSPIESYNSGVNDGDVDPRHSLPTPISPSDYSHSHEEHVAERPPRSNRPPGMGSNSTVVLNSPSMSPSRSSTIRAPTQPVNGHPRAISAPQEPSRSSFEDYRHPSIRPVPKLPPFAHEDRNRLSQEDWFGSAEPSPEVEYVARVSPPTPPPTKESFENVSSKRSGESSEGARKSSVSDRDKRLPTPPHSVSSASTELKNAMRAGFSRGYGGSPSTKSTAPTPSTKSTVPTASTKSTVPSIKDNRLPEKKRADDILLAKEKKKWWARSPKKVLKML